MSPMGTGEKKPKQPPPKPLFWLHGEVKTPPFSTEARIEAGLLLRRLQRGELLSLPVSRPMPSIGKRCHELRVNDEDVTWRIFYRIDDDAILVGGVEEKKTQKTPKAVIDKVKERFRLYDQVTREAEKAQGRKGK